MGKNSWEGTPQDFWIPELVAKDAEYGRQEAHLFVNKLVQLYGKYLLSKEIAMESFLRSLSTNIIYIPMKYRP